LLRTYLRRIVRKRRRIGWRQRGSCQVQGLQLVGLVLQLVVQVLLLQGVQEQQLVGLVLQLVVQVLLPQEVEELLLQWVGMLVGRLGMVTCLWQMSLGWMRRVGMGRSGRRLRAMLWSSRGLEQELGWVMSVMC
jgi:hypothetical protein